MLKPGGRLLVHTFPTKTIYDVTYKWQRALVPWRRRTWPAQPRNAYELGMHVNEQSLWSLQRAMRAAGFATAKASLGDIVYVDHVPDRRHGRLYHRLSRMPFTPIRALGVADLWGEAIR